MKDNIEQWMAEFSTWLTQKGEMSNRDILITGGIGGVITLTLIKLFVC